MTSFVPLDEAISRKRKQEPGSLSDYVYSSPNSPSHPLNLPTDVMDHGYPFGVDPTLTTFEYPSVNDYVSPQHHQHQHHQQQSAGIDPFSNNGFHSRRHSVAVGEMDYHSHTSFSNHSYTIDNTGADHHVNSHSLPFMKQEPLDGMNWGNTDFQHLFGGTSLPSSFSSHSSGATFDSMNALDHPPATHQRTLSLRLDNLPSSHHQDHATCASPTTPVFFSPNFLDALSASTTTEDDGNGFSTYSMAASVSLEASTHGSSMLPVTNSTGSAHYPLSTSYPQHQPLEHDVDLSSGYMIHPDQLALQQQTPSMWMTESTSPTSSTKRASISKRRPSTKTTTTIKSSPPSSPATTTSTCSPSPPITPSQHLSAYDSSFHHHSHPSIPEEDDDLATQGPKATKTAPSFDEEDPITDRTNAERRAKSNLVSARIVQGATSAAQLKPLIQRYLLSDDPSACGEHSVTLLTSRVAQKSYGTEKRFLCPPPTTILSGASWWTTTMEEDDDDSTTCRLLGRAPTLTIHISGEQSSHNGVLEWSHADGSVMDSSDPAAAAATRETSISGKCVSKQLHINDADEKRRRVEVMAKIELGNGLHLGTLASKGIKVISKPSKKRQSLKNMELCIHHGTTVSLFNRIRSQTVSTKYLGVSNGGDASGNGNTGTCFVARTGSWDPFVVWIVDTSRSPDAAASTPPGMPHHPLNPDFPPPPAIALQSDLQSSPIAVHYNQPVVLQCVSTGLVSPVMVIRRVDKGSTVLGGNRVEDLSGLTGGECGDEAVGDPVSQLHKIAFQIIQDPSVAYNTKTAYTNAHPTATLSVSSEWTLPQTSRSVSYLACLNDVVGMHKTTSLRTLVTTKPVELNDISVVSSQIEPAGKVVRKRRVSCDVVPALKNGQRRRVNSLNDVNETGCSRRGSLVDSPPVNGSCWSEDVSDAAVWTIVGTDVAKYTFWTPSDDDDGFSNPFSAQHAITPFPIITHINATARPTLMISGENLARDLTVWFGDIKAPVSEYKSRDILVCHVPDDDVAAASPVARVDEECPQLKKLPLLLVRGDGVVYRTGRFYTF